MKEAARRYNAHSPGLFSREWIETSCRWHYRHLQHILPAYLVGSGLKPKLPALLYHGWFDSPGLFSREWIET